MLFSHIKKSSLRPTGPVLPELMLVSVAGVLLLLLDGMLVHCRLPSSISSGFPDSLLVPSYTPGWREAVADPDLEVRRGKGGGGGRSVR